MDPYGFELNPEALVDEAFARLIDQPWGRAPVWQPRIDVYETPGLYVILVEVPGVPEESVEVRIEGNQLLISGTRSRVRISHSGRAVQLERTQGSFSRSIPLFHPIDPGRMEIDRENGILRIVIPRTDEPRSSPDAD